MPPDERRLKRARLIERVRTQEKRRSALAASDAEALRLRLADVATRTAALSRHYASKSDALTGMDLRSNKAMQVQLEQLVMISTRQAEAAHKRSDETLSDLLVAERRLKQAEADRFELARISTDRNSSR